MIGVDQMHIDPLATIGLVAMHSDEVLSTFDGRTSSVIERHHDKLTHPALDRTHELTVDINLSVFVVIEIQRRLSRNLSELDGAA